MTAALQFGTQIYSCASRYEDSRSKGRSGQGMGEIGRDSGVGHNISQKQIRVIDEARTNFAKVYFASLMKICHLKNAELETKAPKIQKVELYSEVTL